MIEYKVKVYDNRTVWHNLDGKRHRENGPAIEWTNGSKSWWIDGKLHREDGPACEFPDGQWGNNIKEWWINGKELTEDEFNNRNAVEMTVSDIEKLVGKKVKIVNEPNNMDYHTAMVQYQKLSQFSKDYILSVVEFPNFDESCKKK